VRLKTLPDLVVRRLKPQIRVSHHHEHLPLADPLVGRDAHARVGDRGQRPAVPESADDGSDRTSDLFVDLSYDDIQGMYSGLDMLPPAGEDFYSSLFVSPRVRGNQPTGTAGLGPF
jgi:hypothetical protein